MENFPTSIYTHEQSIHALWQKQPAMAAADLLLPCLANLLCVPSFVFLLQHMQTFKQIAPCMHVNNAS